MRGTYKLRFLSVVLVCSKRLVNFVRYVVLKLSFCYFPWAMKEFSPLVTLALTRWCRGSLGGTSLYKIMMSTINKSWLVEKLVFVSSIPSS
ncbi:hypothetical protein MTR67_018718 [Solanum verrucosum]|uniref:Uncharacterized protein n=1 Tax=Solanum verrucosum TaxID=315347 RepID=A0AAF0QLI2_SOLVR|nr:hypothetical protein MTR67_018718 [Solanum verrucosum]